MTRRALLGVILPMLGMRAANAQKAEGFALTATLQEAGDIGYFALSEHCHLMLHPDSALLASTNALLGASVVLSLKRAD